MLVARRHVDGNHVDGEHIDGEHIDGEGPQAEPPAGGVQPLAGPQRQPQAGDVEERGAGLCVIVPAHNEAASVADVVGSVYRALPLARVVVVDDGSFDDTAAQGAAAGAAVISLPVNLGIGGAVQAGFRYAVRHGFDMAVQVDGDGQHDPAETALLLEPIRAGAADMTIGSRWLGRGDYDAPAGRRIGMKILSALVAHRTGRTFTDTTSGFRAVGRAGIALFADHYPVDFPEVEALVLASRHGLRLQEVPVRMEARLHGRSSIAGIRSLYYMARVCLVLLVDSLGRSTRS